MWDRLKQMFERGNGKREAEASPAFPEIPWIEANANPWGVRILDVRPVTLNMRSTSSDPLCAANALSFGQDDGTSFSGMAPSEPTQIAARLRYPIDRQLADGVLFMPREMEHKWALFYHRREILCVRSWTRRVQVVAQVTPGATHIDVTSVRGTFTKGEAPDLTLRTLDYLLRSHALGVPYPAPLAAGLLPNEAAMWCMSMFGNRASFATAETLATRDPETPLRTHSLLHIAVARGDARAVETHVTSGVPIDLLAADGLAPLHWAIAREEISLLDRILRLGSPVDVRSAEGATPLMNAVQSGSVEKTRFLLDRGADADARDARGFTALHRAAHLGSIDLTQLLLRRGAAPHPEAQGQTPRSLALARGDSRIAALLGEG